MDQLKRLYRERLSQLISDNLDVLKNGGPQSYSEYKHIQGTLMGIELARDEFDETWRVFFQDEEGKEQL